MKTLAYHIASLLSDTQEHINFGNSVGANEKINFCKWIIFQEYNLKEIYTIDKINDLYIKFKG